MTMTDPIADMLARLRNANTAHHDTVAMPYSKIKKNIAEILKAEGYIKGWKAEPARDGQSLVLDLKYGADARENARQKNNQIYSSTSRDGVHGVAVHLEVLPGLPALACGLGLEVEAQHEGAVDLIARKPWAKFRNILELRPAPRPRVI